MALLSGVLARCAWIDVNDSSVYTAEVSAHLNRVQRQLLSLISHFGLAESALKKSGNTSRDAQFLLEAHANTILFARNFITKGSSTRLIFAPSLAEATYKADTHARGKTWIKKVLCTDNSERKLTIAYCEQVINFFQSLFLKFFYF